MTWLIESIQVADVDPDAVFRLYADPSTWVSWGHNATRARSDGPLVEGGLVHVRANYGRDYPCRIRRYEPGRALELEVRPPLFVVLNIYEVEPAGYPPCPGVLGPAIRAHAACWNPADLPAPAGRGGRQGP